MKLMDELKFKCLGPGAYDIAPQRSAPCAVVYRHHSAESKRLIIDERPSPGPDYYYSKDDLIKTKTIVHAFGNEPRIKKIKKSDQPLMKIIEARSDKGAVKLQPLNEKNDRAN